MTIQSWQDVFEPGEKLLWEGAPEPMGIPGLGGIALSVFGMPFFGAGLFILYTALTGQTIADEGGGEPWSGFWLFMFGTPFFLVGTGLCLGPWFFYATAHKFTSYALSSHAGYVATNFLRRRMKMYPIDPNMEIELELGRHSSVFFHKSQYKDSDGDIVESRIGFENIRDGRGVYDLIRSVQKELR